MHTALPLLSALLATLALALLLGVAHATAAADQPSGEDPFGFSEDDYSTWGIQNADNPYSGRVGCFPVGNGVIFATLGVDPDFNQLASLTGPGYQTRDDAGGVQYWEAGNWPPMPIKLVRVRETGLPSPRYTFEPVLWRAQSIQQLRGAALVRTVQRNEQLTLYCLTYAVPESCILQREYILLGVQPGETYGLSIDRTAAVYDEQGQQMQGAYRLVTAANPPTYKHDRQGLTVIEGVASTSNGQPRLRFSVSYHVFKADEIYVPDDEGGLGLGDAFLEHFSYWAGEEANPQSCYAHWREWSSHNLRFNTGDARLDDLMAQLPVTIETQRDAASGGYSPMVNYHGYWVRDSLGPIYVNLLNQRFDVVKQMLTYHRKACWKLGSCSMLVPLDIDVSDVREPGSTAVGSTAVPGRDSNGGKVQVPSHEDTGRDARAPATSWDSVPVEHAEVPSLIVLQHYWLWKCMHAAERGDEADAFIAEAWPFITHNLLAMQFDPQFGVRFHGDETYTNGALYSTFDSGLPSQIGYPNGYIPTEFFSFDNTMLHRGAATAMGEMAEALRDTTKRQKVEELEHQLTGIISNYSRGKGMGYGPAISPVTHAIWWAPFSNITLSPWSLGVPWQADLMPPGAEDLSINFQWSFALLNQRPANTGWEVPAIAWWTTQSSGCATGHALGGWLNAARSNDYATFEAELIQQLLHCATPEGAWCEVYDAQAQPVNIYGRVNRIRPWESGINYAMLAGELAGRGALKDETEQRKLAAALDLLVRTADQATRQEYDFRQKERDKDQRGLLYYPAYTLPPSPNTDDTKLLVLTRDNHYQQVLKQDKRFAAMTDQEICAVDIAEQYTPQDLRWILLDIIPSLAGPEHDTVVGPKFPYLYLDRDVKLSDRRTFKTQKFWDELAPVLEEYQAHGGQVIDESSLQISLADDEAVGLKMLLVLYPRTFCWEMDETAIASFHKEIAKWVCWYDQVAGDRLKLQLDFLQIDRRLPPRDCGPQGGNVYWMGYDGVEADLIARGIERGKYDSVCCFWAWDRETPSLPDGTAAAQAYGGAAQGPGSDMAFLGEAGRTSYYGAAVLKSHFVTTGRVALHEYLHNIDAMFGVAGMDDEFFSADDMELHMPQLLKERPGVFAPYGYSDAAMLDLADKSSRGEAGFPWRTQLEYYKWCLERTPKSDFAKLLARFGERVKIAPRTALYDSFRMPEGDQPYQIEFPVGEPLGAPVFVGAAHERPAGGQDNLVGAKPCFAQDSKKEKRAKHGFAPTQEAGAEAGPAVENTGRDARAPGLAPITIEDVDTDGYVHWRSQALGGVISAPYPQPASFYKEAEIVAADLQKIALGQGAAELRVQLRDSVSRQALPGATVKADVAGQNVALSDAGGGVYTTPLPAGLEAEVDVKYSASLPGYVVSENLCALSIKPVWTAEVQFRYSDVDKPPSEAPFKPGIRVTLDGPPGDYMCKLIFATELNTVQQMLASDGLITPTQPFEAEFSAGPRTELYLGLDRHQWEALQYCPGALRVDYTPPGNGLPLGAPTTSFTQRIAPTLPMSALLNGIEAAKLPHYIPRARHFTPTLDGELGEWPAEPSLRLTQQNGHANGAGFTDPDDGATDLWLAYDETHLYVAGRVKDAMLKSGDMWSQDRLNLVFDALLDTTRETYPQGAVGHGGWARDDYWVLLLPFMRGPDGKPQPATMRLGGEIVSGKLGYFGQLAGARAVAVEEPGGYRFEWALPLSSLPYMTPKPGGFCGFTFFLSDHDEGLTELMYLNNWWTPSGIEWRYWDCGLLYFEP